MLAIRRPLLSALLLAAATAPLTSAAAQDTAAAAPALDAAAQRTLVDAAIAQLTANYVYPEKVPAIARAVRRKLGSGGYRAIATPADFAKALTADMQAVAHDHHLAVFWSPAALPPMGPAAAQDAAETKRQEERLARANYAFRKVEVLDGNIGYLRFDGFVPASAGGATLVAAMDFLRHTDALIVDLRENGGGEPGMVQLAMSYLVAPETLINTFHQRGKADRDQFWSLPYVPGGRWSLDKPVYVLVSKNTASAAEEFAYDVQQLKRGTIVGEPTWGGANPGEVHALDAHFAIFVPSGAAINPVSRTNWEGTGVKPDVAAAPADALATARRLALQRLAADAPADRRQALEKLLAAPPPP